MAKAPDIKWISHTSAQEGCDAIKRLLAGPITIDTLRLLQAAEEYENCLPSGQRRVTLHEALIRAVAKVSKQLTADSTEKLTKGKASPVATVDPTKALADAVSGLEKHRDAIIKHEEAFAAASLANRLQIGLHALKAYTLFGQIDPAKRGQGRKGKNQLTRELIHEGGFSGWLQTSAPWLKEPTAYKYMTALRGLGLDHQASEKDVTTALKRRKDKPTLASLIAAATEAIAPPPPEPPKLKQQQFDFLKDSLSHFREQVESLCGIKDQLAANPDFMKAAQARAYSLLRELTGVDWAPSDEPDPISQIDPDSISL